MVWIVGLIALAVGTALGMIITKAQQKEPEPETGSDKIKELQEQLAQAQQTSSEYQDKVSEHFVKTSELFGEMTENYRSAYQHLATGAQSLCKPGTEALLKTSLVEQLSVSELTEDAGKSEIIDTALVEPKRPKDNIEPEAITVAEANASSQVQAQVAEENDVMGEAVKNQPLPDAIHVKKNEESSRPSIH